jgi:hypothetical protein
MGTTNIVGEGTKNQVGITGRSCAGFGSEISSSTRRHRAATQGHNPGTHMQKIKIMKLVAKK